MGGLMNIDVAVLIQHGLTAFVGAVIGTFVAVYMAKRAEFLATQHNFDKLEAQLKRTTQTTEETKASIGDRTWDRQQLREMKTDALVSMMQVLGKAHEQLAALPASHCMEQTGCAKHILLSGWRQGFNNLPRTPMPWERAKTHCT